MMKEKSQTCCRGAEGFWLHADSHRHEAAFEPLADLLLQPEGLRHMDGGLHGATSTGKDQTQALAQSLPKDTHGDS